MIKTVTLPSGRVTTTLGFGGSGLHGGHEAARSRLLVETAFDAGIRHFDVAPSYGHGLAEDVLGDVLASVRDQVTIATKGGIARPTHSGLISTVRRFSGPLRSLAPSLWKAAGHRTRIATRPTGQFAPDQISTSLTESLRRLRTDHVDLYLMHEMAPSDPTSQLVETLQMLQNAGKIGSIGIGADFDAVESVAARYPALGTIRQGPWSMVDPLPAMAPFLITHGPVRRALPVIRQSMKDNLSEMDAFARVIDRDLADDAVVADLLLAAALAANPEGIVLASSSQPDRIRRFAAVARDPSLLTAATALTHKMNDLAQRLSKLERTV